MQVKESQHGLCAGVEVEDGGGDNAAAGMGSVGVVFGFGLYLPDLA